MNKIKIIITLVITLVITGCGPYWYKPHGYIFKQMPKGGTPGFELGWKHGCESGLGTQFGGAIYKSFYEWKRDPDLMVANIDTEKLKAKYKKELPINWDNPQEVDKNVNDYRKIFWRSHIFCRHSVLGTHYLSNNWSPPLTHGPRYTPGDHNLSNVYGFHGKGNSFLTYW